MLEWVVAISRIVGYVCVFGVIVILLIFILSQKGD